MPSDTTSNILSDFKQARMEMAQNKLTDRFIVSITAQCLYNTINIQ